MAWKWKLTKVDYRQDAVDDAGDPVVHDLSRNGRFFVEYQVLDDANTVVDTRTLGFNFDVDQAQAVAGIEAEVRRIRAARQRVASLAGAVGQTFPVS